MRRSLTILSKVLLSIVITLAIVLGSITVFLQTEWGRSRFLSALENAIEQSETKITFEELGGILPFLWELKNVDITFPSGDRITIDSISFRPYLLRLLQRQFALRGVNARNVEYIPVEGTGKEFFQKDLDLPLSLYIKGFHIENLTFPVNGESFSTNLRGKANIDRRGEYIYFKVWAKRKNFDKSSLKLVVESEKKGRVRVTSNVKAESSAFFQPFYEAPFNIGTNLRIRLVGSFDAFRNLVFEPNSQEVLPIRGRITGDIFKLNEKAGAFTEFLFAKDWFYTSRIHLFSNRSMELKNIEVLNKLLDFSGNARFDPGFEMKSFRFDLTTHDLLHFNEFLPFPVSGEIEANIQGERTQDQTNLNVSFHIDSLQMENTYIQELSGSLTSIYQDQKFRGKSNFDMLFYNQFWNGQTNFEWSYGSSLYLNELSMGSYFSDLSGNFEIRPGGTIAGFGNFRIDDLSLFEVLYPSISFYGGLEGTVQFYETLGAQDANLNFHLYDFFFKELHVDYSEVSCNLYDLLERPEGVFHASLDNIYFRGVLFQQVDFTTSTESETWPFTLSGFGDWRDPFEMTATGFWKVQDENFLLNLQNFYGYFFQHSFDLPEPTQFEYSSDHLHLAPTHITFSSSDLKASADLKKDQDSSFNLSLEHFPLDFLSLNPLELSVYGYTNLDIDLKGKKENTSGIVNVEIEEIEILSIADAEPFTGTGQFHANLNGKTIDFQGKFLVREDEHINFDGNVGASLNLMPYKIDWDFDKVVKGTLSYDARAEDILDFINIGPHRFEADVRCNLNFSGTLGDLTVQGGCNVTDGTYDNYYTGTYFEQIEAKFIAKRNRLMMESCSGIDGEGGKFTGNAEFIINPQRNFPFTMKFSFHDLILVDIPLVFATANGTTSIKGNRSGAKAEGTVQVTHTDFSIPEKLPPQIPSLPIRYINEDEAKATERIFLIKKNPFPLSFDIRVLADDNVFINGRGLSSEWRGDFHLGGTYSDLIAQGRLQLLKGDFIFAGKSFDLISGSLTFTGESGAPPYLEISGRTEQSGISIIASLKGKLTGPRLTFRSTPSMPLSAILSYLVFGEDISEITVFQAAQLAAVAASLSGQGPDIFEITRKTLGLDRFRVIHTPSKPSDEGTGGSALQIGKYIMKGLLVSVSQGPDPASGNVSVEVDLTHGFIFQAETIQQQEQGKFTLKWNYNY